MCVAYIKYCADHNFRALKSSILATLDSPASALTALILASRVVLDGVVGADGGELAEETAAALADNDFFQLAHNVHVDAMVQSCAFVAVFRGDTSIGEPPVIIQSFAADDATGVWDERRERLSHALLFERDDLLEKPTAGYLMTYEQTVVFSCAADGSWTVEDRIVNDRWRIPVELFAYKADKSCAFWQVTYYPRRYFIYGRGGALLGEDNA